MKKMLLSLMILGSMNVFGASNLETIMKQMGERMTVLAKQVTDSTLNSTSISLAKEIRLLAVQAKEEVPPKILELPPDQQAAAIEKYKELLSILASHLQTMEYVLSKNNNTLAKSIQDSLIAVMREGHSLFKPPHH